MQDHVQLIYLTAMKSSANVLKYIQLLMIFIETYFKMQALHNTPVYTFILTK